MVERNVIGVIVECNVKHARNVHRNHIHKCHPSRICAPQIKRNREIRVIQKLRDRLVEVVDVEPDGENCQKVIESFGTPIVGKDLLKDPKWDDCHKRRRDEVEQEVEPEDQL